MNELEQRNRINQIKEKIACFVQEYSSSPLSEKEIAIELNISRGELSVFKDALDDLEAEGRVFKTRKKKYGLPEKMNLVVGYLQGHEGGYGFVIPDDTAVRDVFIPASGLNGAMHNDRVVVRVNKMMSTDKRAEGEIIKIIKRANITIIGVFEKAQNFGFVVPDNKRISGDIFIPKSKFNRARSGQKVVVSIVKWPEKRRNAEGEVIEIIGNNNDLNIGILSIIKSHGLVEKFPESVLKQAEAIPDYIAKNAIKKRRDIRNLEMVTIDSEDAKDLDDAVSLERLENGRYRLGVHIADVSEYVSENSQLDREALKRGTSVYLVDRVIPMLPQRLSNGICSLNPSVDRLAMTVFMDIDSQGNVVNHEILESVININERMTYSNVYKILTNSDPEVCKRYQELIETFELMQHLANILYQKRINRGAIDFEFNEVKVDVNEKGEPTSITKRENTIANKIIEEFMIVCNETVAEHFYWDKTPFIYRIHEDPSPDKIKAFKDFIGTMGYKLKGSNKVYPKTLQQLLKNVKGLREEMVISTVMLRSLQKARYSNKNQGHFGLASEYYCHFTSPIRRYPDLIIHRIIKEQLRNKLGPNRENYLEIQLPEIAKQCSITERQAEEAERETEELKKVEFMKKYEGEKFEGIISNVTSFGIFIQLDNMIEGLVKLSAIEDDYYVFDDRAYSVIGERTKKLYKIGDEVKVMLVKANVSTRQLDFIFV